jgi:SAM-dependent methyltransferase
MQAYSAGFAKIYSMRWGHFARQVAPRLRDFYENHPHAPKNRDLLDLCCGAGHLSLHFLEHGYHVTGIDLSEDMLFYARENARDYIEKGMAEFIQADAAGFELDRTFGLCSSTFDALNHMQTLDQLESCFRSVNRVLLENGLFIFDLNTRLGLKRWNGISVEDTDEMMLINRGVYDEQNGRALAYISGFLRVSTQYYERFEETVYNTAFDLAQVRQAMIDSGFSEAYACRGQELGVPLQEPENEGRVFFVGRK